MSAAELSVNTGNLFKAVGRFYAEPCLWFARTVSNFTVSTYNSLSQTTRRIRNEWSNNSLNNSSGQETRTIQISSGLNCHEKNIQELHTKTCLSWAEYELLRDYTEANLDAWKEELNFSDNQNVTKRIPAALSGLPRDIHVVKKVKVSTSW